MSVWMERVHSLDTYIPEVQSLPTDIKISLLGAISATASCSPFVYLDFKTPASRVLLDPFSAVEGFWQQRPSHGFAVVLVFRAQAGDAMYASVHRLQSRQRTRVRYSHECPMRIILSKAALWRLCACFIALFMLLTGTERSPRCPPPVPRPMQQRSITCVSRAKRLGAPLTATDASTGSSIRLRMSGRRYGP